MVKAPSKGLAKFKPWRRGASAKKKSKGSIKHQIRGQERLLAKASNNNDDEQKRAIQERIDELRRQYDARKEKEMEREHAKKSHGTRFLERQRLTRAVKKARDAGDNDALFRLALDQAYVGHYPHDKRYIKLYRNGNRVVDAHKDLVQRARIRDRIMRDIAASKRDQTENARVEWISADQYDRLPSSWSVEDERRVFGERDVAAAAAEGANDSRFLVPATSDAHEKLLRAAEEAEREAMEEEPDNNLDIDGDDDDSDSDSADSEQREKRNRADGKQPRIRETATSASARNDDGSSSDSSSSSSSTSSASSSSSDSEGEGSVHREENVANHSNASLTKEPDEAPPAHEDDGDDDDDDDFLVDATGEESNAFAAAPIVKGLDQVRGDKSQGWATQRQRPGQYKKGYPRQQPSQQQHSHKYRGGGGGKSNRW